MVPDQLDPAMRDLTHMMYYNSDGLKRASTNENDLNLIKLLTAGK